MTKLSRADFLAAKDLELKEHKIKATGYNGSVWLKKMTVKDQLAFEEMANGKDKKNILSKLVVMCVCDEDGNQLFTDADIEALNNKSSAVILELSNSILATNNMSDSDVEDMAKN